MCLFGWLVGWLVFWLVLWLVSFLIGGLVVWLFDCLFTFLLFYFFTYLLTQFFTYFMFYMFLPPSKSLKNNVKDESTYSRKHQVKFINTKNYVINISNVGITLITHNNNNRWKLIDNLIFHVEIPNYNFTATFFNVIV